MMGTEDGEVGRAPRGAFKYQFGRNREPSWMSMKACLGWIVEGLEQ